MTSQPIQPIQPIRPVGLPHLLTVAEYSEIGEVESGYTELIEGRLLLSPSPKPRHNRAAFRMGRELDRQLPRELEVLLDLDVDLQLAPPDAPGTVRRPDLIVIRREAGERVDEEGGLICASDVLVVVEFVSLGSKRADHIEKRGEYADAGIPHYWIVDIEPPVSLIACHLAGEFGYADGGAVTGKFTASAPFPVEIDLDALL
jgi:Uma2 family endonuclease